MAERFVPPAGSDSSFVEVARVSDLNNPQPAFTPELGGFISAVAGDFKRLSPRASGMRCALEAPSATTLNKSIALYIVNALGAVTITTAPGYTINGAASLVIPAGTVRIVRLWSDGVSGWATEYPGLVETGALADGSVTNVKLADNAVTTAKIIDGAVTSAKIADGTIATVDLANSAVTYAKQDQFAKGWEEHIANPWWFDDFFLVEAPTIAAAAVPTTGYIRTRQGDWRLVVNLGTWTISQLAFNNASGMVRFDPDNVNPRSFELFDTVAGGNPFRFDDFRSWGCRVRLRTTITGIRLFCGVYLGGATAAAAFDYQQTTSVNLRARTLNGAGAGTFDTTTGTVWAAGDSHHLRIEKASNSDLLFYVDGVLTNTVPAATHGIVAADPMATYFTWQQTTANGECEIDYIGYRGGGR